MRDDIAFLMAGIFHNLNNYFQAIAGNASLGMNSSDINEMNNHFRIILSTTDKCSETVKQMTALMLNGERESSMVDVGSVVSEIIGIFKPIANDVVHISYSCSCGEVPCVYGNESDISHILLNLLFNSREAIQNNGEICIGVSCVNHHMQLSKGEYDHADYVCISVKDNGSGIPESVQEILFTEVKSTKKGGTHNGIGLVVSQFLAERHGGWIECAHTDHSGTEFVVYLKVFNDGIINKKLNVGT